MRFQVFGPFSAFDDSGAELLVPRKMQRGLLCTLLMYPNQVVRASRLASLLWGSNIPESPGALRTHIWAVRRVLGPASRLHRAPDGYRIEVRPGELDVDGFYELAGHGQCALADRNAYGAVQLLSQALRLWREPPLADMPTPGLRVTIRRLLDERQMVSEVLTDARLALGHSRDLIPELRAQVSMNPARERVWGQLMLALYRSEMRAAALIAFTDARAALANKYGVEPGPVLQRLHRQMLIDCPLMAGAPVGHLARDLAASTSACPLKIALKIATLNSIGDLGDPDPGPEVR